MKPINEMNLAELADRMESDEDIYHDEYVFVERLRELHELTRWIPVEERLPDAEHETFVLAFFGSGRIDIVHCSAVELGIGVTHWRRIDKPEGV
jgi:hypothetical protein